MKNAARARRQGIGNARCRTVVPTIIYLREDRSESYSKKKSRCGPQVNYKYYNSPSSSPVHRARRHGVL